MIEFYDRTAYSLFTLDIPHVRGQELHAAVTFKLSGMFPGDTTKCNIQIRKNGGKKWAYLVFVLNPDTGNAMLPLSSLFVQHSFTQKTGNILYVDQRWFEYIHIENGVIRSSVVKIKDDNRFLDDIKELIGTHDTLVVYCGASDQSRFTPLLENGITIRFIDPQTELKNIPLEKIALFSNKSPAVKRRRVMAAAAMLLALTGCVMFLYHRRKNEHERIARQHVEREQREKANAERQREEQRLSELNAQYQEIIASKKATPFEVAAVIAECAGQQTRIQSATFNNGFFQIEGITGNSLDMLRSFEQHRLVANARLHQVHPVNGRDAFALSGTIQPETVSVDPTIPANERITVLEALIAKETSRTADDAPLSPSAFGEAVKALFTKWGCVVNSYQFMNEEKKTAIEYSLKGSGNGFFNALHDIKNSRRSWDTHLVQIRNLYPRDALDIVVRISTGYHPENNKPVLNIPPQPDTSYPITSISRNYYSRTPAIRPLPAAASPEKPPIPIPKGTERVSWLEYVGSIGDENGNRLIYVKNTKTGEILKLGQDHEGDLRYSIGASGFIIAYIDGHTYEIKRR